ncbi:MAG: hypothetical protein GY757_08360, partial [bacterium]|nr:hypothetical protein [bacterium]
IDVNLFFRLQEKGKAVSWNRDQRKEYYILFSKTGYTTQLTELAAKRDDLHLATPVTPK